MSAPDSARRLPSPPPADDSASTAQPGGEPEPKYPNVAEFVTGFLAPCYVRKRATRAWCPQWWRHPDVIGQFEALWHAWETMRLEGGAAMAAWWVQYANPIMHEVTDVHAGPLSNCELQGHHAPPAPLPLDPPPPGEFRGRDDPRERG